LRNPQVDRSASGPVPPRRPRPHDRTCGIRKWTSPTATTPSARPDLRNPQVDQSASGPACPPPSPRPPRPHDRTCAIRKWTSRSIPSPTLHQTAPETPGDRDYVYGPGAWLPYAVNTPAGPEDHVLVGGALLGVLGDPGAGNPGGGAARRSRATAPARRSSGAAAPERWTTRRAGTPTARRSRRAAAR